MPEGTFVWNLKNLLLNMFFKFQKFQKTGIGGYSKNQILAQHWWKPFFFKNVLDNFLNYNPSSNLFMYIKGNMV
jgi:hypothetical protein